MSKEVFEIKKFTAEITTKKRSAIKTGCCLDDAEPESIKNFETLKEALDELKREEYKPSCVYRDYTVPFYFVTEYAVECYKVDDEGEFLDGSDFDSVYNFAFDDEINDIKTELNKRFK